MRFLPNHSQICFLAALAVAVVALAASYEASAEPRAPIGHRQPNAESVPDSVLREENKLKGDDTALDKGLDICRGC